MPALASYATTVISAAISMPVSAPAATASDGTPPPQLSEVRVDSLNPMLDVEYIEIAGVAGTPLDDYAIVVIGDADDGFGPSLGDSGVVESVTHLAGYAIPQDHALVVHMATLLWITPDVPAELHLEDGDNLTILLVRGASCVDDLDVDDDGVLDATPWSTVVDAVAIECAAPGKMSEHTYASTKVVDTAGFLVFQIRRCPDNGEWKRGGITYAAGVDDTVGILNPPCDGMLCVGDLDRDGSVDAPDLAILLSNWGAFGTVADLDGDATVGSSDITVLLSHWGDCEL